MTVIASPPAHTAPKARPSLAARRFGYLLAALIDAVMLYLINGRPGWDVLPFLTSETEQVLPWVNASIIAGLVVNLVYLGHDPRWLRAVGDMVTNAFSIAAMLVIWDVFPFDFSGSSFDWEIVARILLGLGIVGTLIGFVVALVTYLKTLGED